MKIIVVVIICLIMLLFPIMGYFKRQSAHKKNDIKHGKKKAQGESKMEKEGLHLQINSTPGQTETESVFDDLSNWQINKMSETTDVIHDEQFQKNLLRCSICGNCCIKPHVFRITDIGVMVLDSKNQMMILCLNNECWIKADSGCLYNLMTQRDKVQVVDSKYTLGFEILLSNVNEKNEDFSTEKDSDALMLFVERFGDNQRSTPKDINKLLQDLFPLHIDFCQTIGVSNLDLLIKDGECPDVDRKKIRCAKFFIYKRDSEMLKSTLSRISIREEVSGSKGKLVLLWVSRTIDDFKGTEILSLQRPISFFTAIAVIEQICY